MAHFSGGDTTYSLKFFPIFKGAQDSIKHVNDTLNNFGASGIVALPATIMLNSFLVAFNEVESALSRKCEKEADLKAASIAGHDDRSN